MAQCQITANEELLHRLFLGDSKDPGVAALLAAVLLPTALNESIVAGTGEIVYINGQYLKFSALKFRRIS